MTPSGSSSASRERSERHPAVLLLDTNILLRAARPGFPWREEAGRLLGSTRYVVPASVLRELDVLCGRGVNGARAAFALAATLPSIPSAGEGDDAIVALAIRLRASVLTADRALAVRLREAGCDVVVPRDRNRLQLRRAVPVKGARTPAPATVKKRARLRKPIGVRPRRHARR